MSLSLYNVIRFTGMAQQQQATQISVRSGLAGMPPTR